MERVTKRRPCSHPDGAWFPSHRPSKIHTVQRMDWLLLCYNRLQKSLQIPASL